METDRVIQETIGCVDSETIGRHLYHLSQDPLPCRQLNVTLPEHDRNTLYEADDYIAGQLRKWGYAAERHAVPVQCFRCDDSKPYQHRYSKPHPDDPWIDAFNIFAKRKGSETPEELILLLSHKDSQSWIEGGCPGASDNAVGSVANMEVARVLADYAPRRTIWHLWCNEEHTPWTSVEAAKQLAESDYRVILIINLDGTGRSRAEDREAGRHTTFAVTTTPEGERIAERMRALNEAYRIGLEFGTGSHEKPANDEGSFIRAGMHRAVHHIGCYPYDVADYHTENDTPDLIDVENVALATQLTVATVLDFDRNGVKE